MNRKSGYAQSKIISEILLSKASEKLGYDVRILRVGTISGDTQTGFVNPKDLTSNVLASCLCLEAVVRNASRNFRWIPVDFVAKAITQLSRSPKTLNKVLHLCADGPEFSDFLEVCEQLGKPLTPLPAAEWKSLLEEENEQEIRERIPVCLSVVKHVLPEPEDYFKSKTKPVPTEKTLEYLHEAGIAVPAITKEVIANYVKNLLQR